MQECWSRAGELKSWKMLKSWKKVEVVQKKRCWEIGDGTTVVHNCHGKRKNLAAKEKDSRQKEEPYGKKEKTHGKRKNITAKEKPHGKKKRLTAKEKKPPSPYALFYAVRTLLFLSPWVFYLDKPDNDMRTNYAQLISVIIAQCLQKLYLLITGQS